MADDFASDEDKYANEAFENDTDTELPDNSDTASESEADLDQDSEERNTIYAYTRDHFNACSNDYVPYTSSSDDDDSDVIINKTIAEINTEPMCMKTAIRSSEQEEEEITSEESGSESELQPQVVSDREPQPESEPTLKSDSEGNVENENNSVEIEMLAEQVKSSDIDSVYVSDSKEISKRFDPPLFGDDESARAGRHQYKPGDSGLNGNFYLSPDGSKHRKQLSPRSNRDSVKVDSPRTEAKLQLPVDTPRTEAKLQLPVDPHIEFCISSHTPSSFSAENYAFHMNFMQKPATNLRIKNAHRKSWSFTNERMREIERQNQILLKKILSQKGTYSLHQKKSNTNLQNISVTTSKPSTRQATAAVNRKKQQRQIDLDNQVLKRKIEAISYRRPPVL